MALASSITLPRRQQVSTMNGIERSINVDRRIERDAMNFKAFEQQTVPDATPLLTYLPDRACWSATESNQSPIEASKSSKVRIDAHANK